MSLRHLYLLLGIIFCQPAYADGEALIREILSLPPDRITQMPLVKIRGMITTLGEGIATPNPKFGSLVLDDKSGGLWVNINRAKRRKILKSSQETLDSLAVGMMVEIQGQVADGAYAPVLLPATIKVLESPRMPAARQADLEQFLRGGDYLRTVSVEGVVQKVAEEKSYGWLLQIETGLGHFLCRLPKRAPYSAQNLLDARIRVSGVAAASRNWRREFVCPRLIVSRDDDFQILQPPNPDPFRAKSVELQRLNAFSFDGTSLHRIRVEGVVTFADNSGCVYIQVDDFALRIQTVETPALLQGDFIEVAGFIDTSKQVAELNGAVVRVNGKREIPVPLKIRFTEVLRQHEKLLKGETTQLPGYDGIYAELTGEVLSHHFEVDRSRSHLELDCGDSISTVTVIGSTYPLLPGSRISARGVVKFQYDSPLETSYYTPPSRLDLMVAGNAMIKVLSGPSWWTVERALVALGLAACLGTAVAVWAFSLKRTLKRKVQQLAAEINDRHDAALEFQAALRERTRLAANLHDTLLQTMAGINYQLEACSRKVSDANASFSLHTAQKMVQCGQADLRDAVWALRILPQMQGPFADAADKVVRQAVGDRPCHFKTTVDPFLGHLADFVAGNLLMVIQESVSNAIQHANPRSIAVEVQRLTAPARICVRVTDDGGGFSVTEYPNVTEGHFGIQGMEERIQNLKGHFQIKSVPEKGTTVSAVIPLREFDDLLEES